MGCYSDIDEIDLALRDLERSSSRDEYEKRLAVLARLATAHSNEIISIYHVGAFDQMPLVWCLQGQSSDAVISLFHEAIKHRNQFIRWAAAEGIDKSGRNDQVGVFVGALKDRSHLVKSVAVEYLKRHGDETALPGLSHLVGLKSMRNNSPGTVKSAEEAIKEIRKKRT